MHTGKYGAPNTLWRTFIKRNLEPLAGKRTFTALLISSWLTAAPTAELAPVDDTSRKPGWETGSCGCCLTGSKGSINAPAKPRRAKEGAEAGEALPHA